MFEMLHHAYLAFLDSKPLIDFYPCLYIDENLQHFCQLYVPFLQSNSAALQATPSLLLRLIFYLAKGGQEFLFPTKGFHYAF